MKPDADTEEKIVLVFLYALWILSSKKHQLEPRILVFWPLATQL